jgi:hypothetical protein
MKNAVEWINEWNPAYVLVGLNDFDDENCVNEQQLSWFLESKSIPAHFHLPERLGIHNVTAMALSAKTGIKDLWSCPLGGEKFWNHIQNFVAAHSWPKINRSAAW